MKKVNKSMDKRIRLRRRNNPVTALAVIVLFSIVCVGAYNLTSKGSNKSANLVFNNARIHDGDFIRDGKIQYYYVDTDGKFVDIVYLNGDSYRTNIQNVILYN